MAFPFEALDFFLPEIAHWMAGKSPSERVRMHRAGRGLLMLGLGVACVTLLLRRFGAMGFWFHRMGLDAGSAVWCLRSWLAAVCLGLPAR